MIAVGTVVPDINRKGKNDNNPNDEIPMKGKKCSENDIKYNRVAPKKNNPPPRRQRNESSSSSDEEAKNNVNACYGSPVIKQHIKGEGMGLFDQ